MTVWTHTQGVYPDRAGIAEMLRVPPASVRLIHVEGSGCYGHNGADDAAADAALIARAMPGIPVRVQWMREQEHAWEPFGPAMVTKLKASLDGNGAIVDWNFEVWSNTHSMRPGGAGSMLAAQHMAQAFAVPAPKPLPLPEGGGDRNAIPFYKFPSAKVVHHFIPKMPLRISAMRALGAYHNVFSIESFMDELAVAAVADPVEFRLKHLDDARGRDVIEKAAKEFGWQKGQKAPPNRGYGFAFARYKNLAAYCAIATEVEVNRAERPSAAGARGGGGRQRASRQSRRADQPDRRRDFAVDELDAVRERHLRRRRALPASIGRPIRSCASTRCRKRSTSTSSTAPVSRSSAAAKPARARRRPRSPMRSRMPPESGCAICR